MGRLPLLLLPVLLAAGDAPPEGGPRDPQALLEELYAEGPPLPGWRLDPGADPAAALRAHAHAAFDRGRFALFRALVRASGERTAFAEHLAALPILEGRPTALVDPGPLVPLPPHVRTADPAAPFATRWDRFGEWLIAREPWGAERWRRRVEAGARVVHGPGLIAIQEGTRVRCYDEAGRARGDHRHVDGARLIAVRDGRTVAVAGRVVHVGRGTDPGIAIDLGAEPIGAPLVAGERSLWLTAHRLILVDGDAAVARWRHRLDDPRAWRPVHAGGGAALLHRDGRARAIADFSRRFDDATSRERIALLARADRFATAFEFARDFDDLAAQRRLLARRPDLLPPGVRRRELCLADDPHALEACLRLGEDPLLAGHLADNWRRHPDHLVNLGADPAIAPRRAAWCASLAALCDPFADPDRHRGEEWILVRADDDAAETIVWRRDHHPRLGIVHRHAGRCYRYLRDEDAGAIVVACHRDDPDAAILWQRRWPAASYLPSLHATMCDGWLLIVEGQNRLTLLDPADGGEAGTWVLPARYAFPSQMAIVRPGRFAVLHPIGLGTRLTVLADNDGELAATDHRPPVPGRVVLPRGDGFVCLLVDGRWWSPEDGYVDALGGLDGARVDEAPGGVAVDGVRHRRVVEDHGH